jgi:N-acetylglutamate synthase-like GNAT family acetyltransferase
VEKTHLHKIEELDFRIATLNDIPVLCELLIQLFSQEVEFVPDYESHEKALRKIIKDENIGHIFVAEKENKVIAMVNILYTISTALGEKVAILEDMIVLNSFRNQKIGSELIKYALNFLKENDIKRVTLLTDGDNFNAHKFYEKQGFNKSSMIAFRKSL